MVSLLNFGLFRKNKFRNMRRLYTTIISLSIFGWAGAQISTNTKLMNGAIYGGPQKLEKNAGKVFLD